MIRRHILTRLGHSAGLAAALTAAATLGARLLPAIRLTKLPGSVLHYHYHGFLGQAVESQVVRLLAVRHPWHRHYIGVVHDHQWTAFGRRTTTIFTVTPR